MVRSMAPHSPDRPAPTLGVIVPAHNEAATIGQILGRVLYQPCVQQVVVVDDCSTDDTFRAAQAYASDPRVILKRHPANAGKGAAIRTGLAAITAPIVIIEDADLEYEPGDYGKLTGPLVEGRAHGVHGPRGFAGQTRHAFWSRT